MDNIKQILEQQQFQQKTESQPILQKTSSVNLDQIFGAVVYEGQKRLKKIGKEFIIDKENEEVIRQICSYFLGIECGLNLEKGLFVWGNVGSGKSLIFELIREIMWKYPIPNEMKEKSFRIEGCEEIADKSKFEGESVIYSFNHGNICFDELGGEDVKKHFGDVQNTMASIIKIRYKLFWNKNLKTHFTSNLNSELLISTYGEREFSRLKEICNILKLHGIDRRLT